MKNAEKEVRDTCCRGSGGDSLRNAPKIGGLGG